MAAPRMSCAAAYVLPATAQAAAVAAPAGAALEAAAAGAKPQRCSCSRLPPLDCACSQQLCMLRHRCSIVVALAAQLVGWPAAPAPTCRQRIGALTYMCTRRSYGQIAVITVGSRDTHLLKRTRPEKRMRQRPGSAGWHRLAKAQCLRHRLEQPAEHAHLQC